MDSNMSSPKTRDELALENALLVQGKSLTKEFGQMLDAKFLDFKNEMVERDKAQNEINLRVENRLTVSEAAISSLKVKIWSISGGFGAAGAVIGFMISNFWGK